MWLLYSDNSGGLHGNEEVAAGDNEGYIRHSGGINGVITEQWGSVRWCLWYSGAVADG